MGGRQCLVFVGSLVRFFNGGHFGIPMAVLLYTLVVMQLSPMAAGLYTVITMIGTMFVRDQLILVSSGRGSSPSK